MRRKNVRGLRDARRTCLAAALSAAFALGGCSSLGDVFTGHAVDYQSAKAGPSLDVPPNLTQLSRDEQYSIPGEGARQPSVSALAYQTKAQPVQQQASSQDVLPSYPGLHIEQLGTQRWLVVDQAPSAALWDKVKTFWQRNGFYLTESDRKLGVMQTNWAENRAKLPQDFIRKYLGKVFNSLYDTGTRDRYRTVFERTADGKGTQIFISHSTMVQVYTDQQHLQTAWQPGTPDPTLDEVFLRKLMVALGATQQQAQQQLAHAQSQAQQAPQAELVDSGHALQLPDAFEQAWRRVSLALNTAGFTVTGRDRSNGSFDVRYLDPQAVLRAEKDKPGFFGKLFGRKAPTVEPQRMRVVVQAAGSGSRVTVQALDSGPNAAESQTAILKVLLQQLQ